MGASDAKQNKAKRNEAKQSKAKEEEMQADDGMEAISRRRLSFLLMLIFIQVSFADCCAEGEGTLGH